MNASVIYSGIERVVQSITGMHQYVDSKFEKKSPSKLILSTAVTLLALKALAYYCQSRWGETRREQIGRLVLGIPFVKRKYIKDINKELIHFQESVKKKWEKFGPPMIAIPEEGWSVKELLALIKKYSEVTTTGLKGKHISGTIYSKSLDSEYREFAFPDFDEKLENTSIEKDEEYFSYLSKKLEYIFTVAFKESHLWNSLHGDEFGVGAFIEYQVVRIIAKLIGAAPEEVMGFVTSGGTESLMDAVRVYRNWGVTNRGHEPGESVIIASKDVHAAVLKGGKAYNVHIVLVDTDETGKIDLKKLEEAVKKHGNKVVAIIGSAPSYPKGVIDPIKEMAEIAQKNGVGMHVDCCLGGFIIDKVSKDQARYFTYPGVTSGSVDTHKNGWAAKGSSVLIFKELDGENLAYHSMFAIPEWPGGAYGSPSGPGSKSCTPAFIAFLSLLAIGQKGYQRIAEAIHKTACQLANVINEFNGKLKLVAQPEVNVVAFQIDKQWGLEKGATYAFAHEMAKRNFTLNTLNNDMVHFCVTGRIASNAKALDQFRKAVEESLNAVENLNKELKKSGKKFPGDAGMYCALEAAITPDKKELSVAKYVENFLFGILGARDAVRAYFLAQLDPFKQVKQ